MTTWPDAIVRGGKVAGMDIESPWLLKGYGWLLVDVVQTATDPEQAGGLARFPPPAGQCARPTTIPARRSSAR
jgi:hypothetical protein